MAAETSFDYYYGDESSQFSIYRIPRQLITGERFKLLSTDAKLLYGLLLDRMSLSAQNGWHDNTGRVYIYYTVNDVCQDIGCGRNKAMRLLASRLYETEQEKISSEYTEKRRSQVGSGMRNERIRTYNFPQGRCTDHRINLTLYSLDRIMEASWRRCLTPCPQRRRPRRSRLRPRIWPCSADDSPPTIRRTA